MKRFFDIFFSLAGLIILSPLFFVISIIIILDSRGGVLFIQKRVGKNNFDFKMFKFRTMKINSDKKGLLTVGSKDMRITRAGYYLRKFKLDELPQLINVLIGNMSFVGPRPEVRKYVDLYNEEQKKVLSIKPGISDYASIIYADENTILARSENPEEYYIQYIMPRKLSLNLKYLQNKGLVKDVYIIYRTLLRIIKR